MSSSGVHGPFLIPSLSQHGGLPMALHLALCSLHPAAMLCYIHACPVWFVILYIAARGECEWELCRLSWANYLTRFSLTHVLLASRLLALCVVCTTCVHAWLSPFRSTTSHGRWKLTSPLINTCRRKGYRVKLLLVLAATWERVSSLGLSSSTSNASTEFDYYRERIFRLC
jgi:hypothetical protein